MADSIAGLALEGTDAADRLIGAAGDDTLTGGGGADRLFGGDGADRIQDDAGRLRLFGGAGDDRILIGSGQTGAVDGGAGRDSLSSSGGDLTGLVFAAVETLLVKDAVTATARQFESFDAIQRYDGKVVPIFLLLHGGGRLDLAGELGARSVWFKLSGRAADVTLGAGDDMAFGGAGSDTLAGGAGDDALYGLAGDNLLDGGAGDDGLLGGTGRDRLNGGAGGDALEGGKGADRLAGGAGRDRLAGGLGADVMSGGADPDTFVFASSAESTARAPDRIADFAPGADRIDLRMIDADPDSPGDQAFRFLSSRAFTGGDGQLRFVDGLLSADLDGDRRADFAVEMADVSALGLADLLL